jgi:AcrR family transcriptional regulator
MAVVKKNRGFGDPPGKIKLANALRCLLATKDFNSITTAEIAARAQTNEALIYRYFGDKRGLLHQILAEYLKDMEEKTNSDSQNIKDPIKRLKQLIWDTLKYYNENKVFAKTIIVESRNFPGFFESETYQLVKNYARFYEDIINKGVELGQIRGDIPPSRIRDAIIGSIEHFVLPAVLFGKELSADDCSENIFQIVMNGIAEKEDKESVIGNEA